MSNARNLANLLGTGSTIATAKIANAAVSTAKIADDAVTAAKVDDDGTGFTVGDLTIGSTAAKKAGVETIWIPSLAMNPTNSNGCAAHAVVETTSGRPDMIVLDFDKDSDEFAQFSICFPKSWNEGTITYQAYWSGIAATTGVAWSLDAVAVSDNETIDVAYGTAITVTDAGIGTVEDQQVSAESGKADIEELKKLKELLDAGVITQEEFIKAKKQILN